MHKKGLLHGKRILLIDPDEKKENDKTFCFWGYDHEDIVEDYSELITTRWNKIQINNGEAKPIEPLKYAHIKSIDLYNHSRELVSQYDATWVKSFVLNIDRKELLCIHTKQTNYYGNYVFDSRPQRIKEPLQKKYAISQSFYGLKIKRLNGCFDRNVYRMMDFRVSQSQATQFVYILPYNEHEALVELTRFGKNILHVHEAENILDTFIHDNFGAYTVIGKERGIIPMNPVLPESSKTTNLINIGSRGGNVKPSTGYAFKNMYNQSKFICASNSFQQSSPPKKSRFLFYDQLLLIILTRWPGKGRAIFERLFHTNSPFFVLNFLDEKSKVIEELKMFFKLQIGIFLKSLWYWTLWRMKKFVVPILMILLVFLPSGPPTAHGLQIPLYQICILILGLLLIGIPHGALDHYTEAIEKEKKVSMKFIVRYILLMAPIFLLWLWEPPLALIVFLIYSAWHFGQTDTKQWGVRSKIIGFIWGATVLSYLFITHLNELNSVLNALKIHSIERVEGIRIIKTILILCGFTLAIIFRKLEWFLVVIFLMLAQYTNLVFSFGIYFVLHHSRLGWFHLKRKLQMSHYYMFKKALPFNIGALAMFVFFFIHIELSVKENIAYFFIFLSCVSFPHVLCMNVFYNKTS